MQKSLLLIILLAFFPFDTLGIIRVAIQDIPPLASCSLGNFTGVLIQTWKSLMIQIGEDYRLECVENFEEFAEDSSLDIYVGLTDYTTESSKQPDFRYTLPLFTTGLSLLSKGYETSEAFRFLTIFDTTLWLIIIAGIFFVAHLIWAYEKDEKGAFDPDYGKGILYALNQTILVVFFANNLNIRTAAGRIIVGAFMFVMAVVAVIYLAKLASLFSKSFYDGDYLSLDDYSSNDIIGTWTPYKNRLKAYAGDVIITDYSSIDLENMVDDLNDDLIQGLVLDWPFLSNITQNYNQDCNLFIVEELDQESFHPIYAKKDFSQEILQKINTEVVGHTFRGRTELLLKNAFPSSICFSDNIYIPISLNFVWGIFIFVIGGVLISITKLLIEIYYEKYGKGHNAQLDDNSKDFQKDIHVLLQFDKILSVSSSKFTFRMKDLCSVVIGVGTQAKSYKVQLQNLEKDLHAI